MAGRETIELDEPAACNHAPPDWPIRTIELKVIGKAPKHYGPDVYRFGAALTLSVILPRRGWTLIKQTKNYAYLRPPTDQGGPPFQISIAIPEGDECVAIARRSYARSESWMGQLGEWPAWYFHERRYGSRRISRDPLTGEMVINALEQSPPESSLSIGEWGVWEAKVTGVGGDFIMGLLPASPSVTLPMQPDEKLGEGGAQSVELTRYERNKEARRRCLEHFGAKCQACDFTYEAKYGAIGADLIHVHHITPMASIGAAYQVDPIRDLIPLCANCHHVAHRRDPPYLASEISAAIAARATLPLARL